MNRAMSMFLAGILIVALVACGDTGEHTDAQGGQEQAEMSQEAKTQEHVESQKASDTPGSDPASSGEESGSNILVAYFSRVGNTEFDADVDAVTSASLNLEGDILVGNAEVLARMAQEITGGDLFLIETAEPYPSSYDETTDVAAEEQDNDARPELSSHVENMDHYDTVILIYPNWWGTLPQPLFSFLEEYDFSGKTILPLCTHAGSRMGRSEEDIAGLCPSAMLLEGLAVRGSEVYDAQADVENWIMESGILN